MAKGRKDEMKVIICFLLIVCFTIAPVSVHGGLPVKGDDIENISFRYKMLGDGTFNGGVIIFHPTQAIFIVENISKRPFDFKGATYCAVATDGSIRHLKFDTILKYHFSVRNRVCHPQQTIVINCVAAHNLEDIEAFHVRLRNGRELHFRHKELTFWQKISRYIKNVFK